MIVLGIDVLTFLLIAPGVAGAILLLMPGNKQIVRWTALAL